MFLQKTKQSKSINKQINFINKVFKLTQIQTNEIASFNQNITQYLQNQYRCQISMFNQSPIQISFIDPQKHITSNIYPLKNGQCDINEKMYLDIQATYETEKSMYNQCQLSLIATIASNNSNIPAGTAMFNPFILQPGQDRQVFEPLQKCSDRQAKIQFSFNYLYLEKIRDFSYEQQKSNRKIPVRSYVKTYRTGEYANYRQKQMINSIEKSQVDEMITESRVRQFGQGINRIPPKDYMRQKLKTYGNQTNQRRQNALKSEVELMTLEVEKYKQKCRNFERKQRELNLIIKDLKDNIEKKKFKIIDTESVKSSFEMTLNEKQKMIKQLKVDIKRLNQKIQDLKLLNIKLQKKFQIKERAFQEQLKGYSEKTSQLEKQISKKTYESNSLLQKMQFSEKNNQLSNKEKQKHAIEQKNKLIKNIEHLNYEIQRLNDLSEEKETKIINLTNSNKSISQENIIKLNLIQKLQSDLDITKIQLKSQKENRSVLQKQLDELSSAQTDKNAFKKKYNETLQLLNKLNEKYQRVILSQNQLQIKFNDIEEKNKEMNKTIKQLNVNINSLNNELENLRKQNSTLNIEQNSLSAKNLNLTQKLNDIKSKLDAQKQQFEQMLAHYEDKLNYLMKSKEYIENQADDWKEKYQKLEHINFELENKCKAFNEQILIRHKQSIQFEEIIKKNQQTIEQLGVKMTRMNTEIQMWQKKQKKLQESVKSKGNDVYELQRKATNQEQELFLLTQKIQSLTQSEEALKTLYEKTTEQKDKIIIIKTNELEQLKNQYDNLVQSYEQITYEFTNKKKEALILDDQIKQHLEIMQISKKKIIQFESLTQISRNKIITLEEELSNLKNRHTQKSDYYKTLEQNWAIYRNNTMKALEQFIDQISLDQCSVDVELFKFDDSNLETMQITALKTRNQIITKYRSNIAGLEENIQFYKKQIQKLKFLHEEKEGQFEKQMVKLTSKMTDSYHKYMEEKEDLNGKISAILGEKQEFISEIQKYKSKIVKLKEIIDQLNQQRQILEIQVDNKENQIALLQEQILQMKSNSIQQKNSVENNLKNFKDTSQQQIQTLKKNINEISEKSLNLQKEKQEKQNKIIELKDQILNLKSDAQKESVKKSQVDQKFKQSEREVKQLRLIISNKDHIISDLTITANGLKIELKSNQDKILLLQTQRKQIYEQLTSVTLKKQQLTRDLAQCKEKSINIETQLKEISQISSFNFESLTLEIKQQKDRITNLQSEIELKNYVILQLQKGKQINESEIKELNKDLQTKKQTLIILNKEIENFKNNIMKFEESSNHYSSELRSAKEENFINLEKIVELQAIINELAPQAEQLTIRLEELDLIKKCVAQLQNDNHKISLQLKSTQNQVKNLSNKLSNKEQDYRKRIQSLQSQIHEKQLLFNQTQQRLNSDWQRQKTMLIKQLEQQDKLLREQQQESKFRIQQLQEQINTLNQDCLELSHLLEEKQEEIIQIQQQFDESERKISQLNHELKLCLEAWDKQKLSYIPSRKQITELQMEMNRFEEYANDLDSKTKQVILIANGKVNQQSKYGISDILKDLSSTISKSKNKILNKIESQEQKQSIVNEYKILQQKFDSIIRSQGIIYK